MLERANLGRRVRDPAEGHADRPKRKWLAHLHGRVSSLCRACWRLRSRKSTKVSGCRSVGVVSIKGKRGGRSRRVSEDSANGSEQESEADLDLTTGVGEVAVAAGRRGEWRIKVQAGQIGGSYCAQSTGYDCSIRGCNVSRGNPIPECLRAGYVGTIEQVEALTKHFKLVVFSEAEFLGDSEVDNLGSWKVEGVAADDVYALASVRAVHSPTQSSGGISSSDERKGQTILYLIDRSKFPSPHKAVRPARGLPWRFRNATEDEAVGDVEVRVA